MSIHRKQPVATPRSARDSIRAPRPPFPGPLLNLSLSPPTGLIDVPDCRGDAACWAIRPHAGGSFFPALPVSYRSAPQDPAPARMRDGVRRTRGIGASTPFSQFGLYRPAFTQFALRGAALGDQPQVTTIVAADSLWLTRLCLSCPLLSDLILPYLG